MAVPGNVAAVVIRLCTRRAGRLFLANALDSLDASLVDEQFARDLLVDLAREVAMRPGDDWPHSLARVCNGAFGVSKGYLRASRVPTEPVDSASRWTTLISATTWTDWHCDRNRPSARALGAFPPGPDASFAQRFQVLVAEPDWAVAAGPAGSGATVGLPRVPGFQQGPNCWVSCAELDESFTVPPSAMQGSARRVHEALGMEPPAYSPLDSWIRYEIDAASVRREAGQDAHRPNFADLGNRWFRVRTASSRAAYYAARGWGCTANLTVIRARRRGDTGRPEKVVASIPVSKPFILGAEWLPLAQQHRQRVRYPTKAFRQTRPYALKSSELLVALLGRLWP